MKHFCKNHPASLATDFRNLNLRRVAIGYIATLGETKFLSIRILSFGDFSSEISGTAVDSHSEGKEVKKFRHQA